MKNLLVIVSSCFPLLSSNRTDSSRFEEQRRALRAVTNPAEIECFKTAFRNAVANAGYEIKDDFIRLWTHMSGWKQYGMQYHLLTVDGIYHVFMVESSQSEDVAKAIAWGIPLKDIGITLEEINSSVYYVDGDLIILDELLKKQ